MSLNDIFLQFACYGTRQPETQLDGSKFTKLCKDCHIIEAKKFTSIDADITFSKVKTKGSRKLSYSEFKQALVLIAEKKGLTVAELEESITASGGPKSNATKADFVKFHDDKSTYTGVHGKGGPSTIDGNKDLSSILDRGSADVRGVPTNKESNFAKQR